MFWKSSLSIRDYSKEQDRLEVSPIKGKKLYSVIWEESSYLLEAQKMSYFHRSYTTFFFFLENGPILNSGNTLF